MPNVNSPQAAREVHPLRLVRMAKGLTTRDAARLCGMSHQGWINLERDGANPRLSTLRSIADKLALKSSEIHHLFWNM